MQAIMSLSDRVMVLAKPRRSWRFHPKIHDQRVIKAYLGDYQNLLALRISV
jgi:ABC-type branched-subunit amino acid transport system ATPase component